ncbi:hypothetical protein [Prosthecomicrobium sp. N25]|uniref:hypothetical protein n=1 Tax=Prosthecomicrobium sp. N25 TaxID=3129254 RepID=UPI003077A27B
MVVQIDFPVGLRDRKTPVRNMQADQAKVLGLLAEIPEDKGGFRARWIALGPMRPQAGADGAIPRDVAEAIWQFQLFWKNRGVFKVIDGVVDPDGNTLKKMNELAEDLHGEARVIVGSDAILAAYPEFASVMNPSHRSILVEMWNFDIGGDQLKIRHRNAIFDAKLKAFDKDFTFVNAYGFHSNTGGPAFDNHALAERRAQNAVTEARLGGAIDARIRRWNYMGIDWRPGMPTGEVAEMRKVLLLWRAESSFDDFTPQPGMKMRLF